MADSLGMAQEVFSPDNLLAGHQNINTIAITLLAGENRSRGALLGKITKAVGTIVPGTNTGNGTVSAYSLGKKAKIGNYKLKCYAQTKGKAAGTVVPGTNTGNGTVSSVTPGSKAQVGNYKLTCISAVENGGVFKVVAPDGERLDDATVGVAYSNSHINFTINDGATDFASGDSCTIPIANTDSNLGVFKVLDPDGERLEDAVVGSAYASNHINFTINDGATDFASDDEFTLPVVAGSGKYKLSLAASVDGSQDPCAILTENKNATSEDKATVAYVSGPFNENALTYGSGHTKTSVKDALQAIGIYLKSPVAA